MIEQYGWCDRLAEEFEPHAADGRTPGRILVQHRDGYLVATKSGELRAKMSSRLRKEAKDAGHPAVGDWVALSVDPVERTGNIEAILPRRTAFVRRAAHSVHTSQVVAANVDVVFVVTSLNADLNPRRIERYLAAASQSGAKPVLVLTKSDLCADPQARVSEIAAVAAGFPIVVVSARDDVGLDLLLAHVRKGETCVLVGSSGVGKSTLVNAFLGAERMATHAVREGDDQGRHTTSHRELVLLSNGALIMDTPGMRELGLIDADEGVSAAFEDIEQLAGRCRFNDCAHANEPDCAIRDALESGLLDPARWANFQKLGLELRAAEDKAERAAADAERQRLAPGQKARRAVRRDRRSGA